MNINRNYFNIIYSAGYIQALNMLLHPNSSLINLPIKDEPFSLIFSLRQSKYQTIWILKI